MVWPITAEECYVTECYVRECYVCEKGKSMNAIAVPKKWTMSAAARKKIAAAQCARWAKVRAAKKAATKWQTA